VLFFFLSKHQFQRIAAAVLFLIDDTLLHIKQPSVESAVLLYERADNESD